MVDAPGHVCGQQTARTPSGTVGEAPAAHTALRVFISGLARKADMKPNVFSMITSVISYVLKVLFEADALAHVTRGRTKVGDGGWKGPGVKTWRRNSGVGKELRERARR